MPLATGTRFGPYEILSQLGAGGMGEVYRARDARLGRDVAIKVLPQHMASNTEALARFEREAKAVAALAHPNVVVLYDCGTQDSVAFVVMELLAGESLRTRLGRGPIPWQKAIELGIELADGLFAAHAKGVIHRDLKPENIFLTPEDRIKILDFGLARLEGTPVPASEIESAPDRDTRMDFGPALPTRVPESASAETYVPPNEARSTLMGTVGYMSPEHLMGQAVDARTDIFALGCVLYEMLTGRRAFSRPTPAETISDVLTKEPEEMEDLAEVPAPIQSLVRRCLAKEANQRHASARDVVTDLRQIQRAATSSRARGSRIAVWTLGAALTVALILTLYLLANRDTQVRRSIDSIAVLPFKSGGDQERAGHLSNGLTDNLIRALSDATDLRVSSRSTVAQFRELAHDPQAWGRQLGVKSVLTGRVALQDESLTIEVELIDVRDGGRLWSERLDRKMADLQLVQEELATEIANKLRLQLTNEQRKELTKHHTQDSQALELYMRGRSYWNQRTDEGLRKAIEYFQEATQRDPQFALAFSGIAESYNLRASYGYDSPEKAFPKAKAAAERARRLDNTLAEAHAALAQIKELWERDWAGAEAEYQRALQHRPNYATAHQWYAFSLAEMGRLKEAKAAIQRAKEYDPLSLSINTAEGWILYLARQYDAAIDQYKKTLSIDPDFAQAHASLGLALAQKGQYAEAIAEIEQARKHAVDDVELLAQLGQVRARAGQHAEARAILKQLSDVGSRKYVSAYYLAIIYAALGDIDKALDQLEEAFEAKACAVVSLGIDPHLDPLRADPRFAKLLSRLALPRSP